MKKYLAVLVLALMFVGGMGVKAYAAPGSSDSFTITAAVSSTLNIVCKQSDDTTAYGTWAVGTTAVSTATNMLLANVVKIVNTSSVAVNLSGTASTTAAWSAGTTAGANTYVLKLISLAAAPADQPALATALGTATAVTTGTQFGSIDTPATNSFVYASFTTPASSTSGAAQSVSVTITATVK